jgi:hypothetical protein
MALFAIFRPDEYFFNVGHPIWQRLVFRLLGDGLSVIQTTQQADQAD